MNDAAYVEALKQNRHEQVVEASELRSVSRAMKAYREKIKAALPSGSDSAALEAALAKDAGWLELKARHDKLKKQSQQTLVAARERIRAALVEEARAQDAVAAGQAKAIDESLVGQSQTQKTVSAPSSKQ